MNLVVKYALVRFRKRLQAQWSLLTDEWVGSAREIWGVVRDLTAAIVFDGGLVEDAVEYPLYRTTLSEGAPNVKYGSIYDTKKLAKNRDMIEAQSSYWTVLHSYLRFGG